MHPSSPPPRTPSAGARGGNDIDAASAEQAGTTRACSVCREQLVLTRGHGGHPMRALQAGVLLRQSMPSRALEAGRAQAGVQGADGVLHLLGQRRPAAANHAIGLDVAHILHI